MILSLFRGHSLMAVLCGLLLYATPALAQTGSIAGVLVDSETGDPLIGANAIIAGTSIGTATDIDGTYTIPNLEPGTYTVQFSYIGYNPTTVQGVEVTAGETTRLDLSLSPEALEVGEVVVEAAALTNTEAALLRERAKASAVSDAISAEAISRSGSCSRSSPRYRSSPSVAPVCRCPAARSVAPTCSRRAATSSTDTAA